jgi:diguanylate cyclase (GGDEF)-like protein
MDETLLVETHYNLIPFGVYVVDVETLDVLFMNATMRKLRGDHSGQKCYWAIYGLPEPCDFCRIKDLVDQRGRPNGATVVFEHFHELDDRWYQLQEKVIGWSNGRTVKCSIAVDVTELKETQNRLVEAHAQLALKSRELKRLSITDRLTGIANRFRLDEVLSKEVERTNRYETPLSIMIMDVDQFKLVNDTHGHQVGDLVLHELAKLLNSNIRTTDTLGRWGGEEFLIICPGIELEGAASMAEKLRMRIAEYHFGPVSKQTVSFGLAQCAVGETSEDLVRRADQALYRAKDKGRNRVEVDTPPSD